MFQLLGAHASAPVIDVSLVCLTSPSVSIKFNVVLTIKAI